jgi:hypothetical protein
MVTARDVSGRHLTPGGELRYVAGVSKPQAWGMAVVAVLGLGLASWAYRTLDRAGWIAHTSETQMYMGAMPWPDAQERSCVALPAQNGAIIFLGCGAVAGDSVPTEMQTVTFWGRIRRPDRFVVLTDEFRMEAWKWRCRKRRMGLTCWAVN